MRTFFIAILMAIGLVSGSDAAEMMRFSAGLAGWTKVSFPRIAAADFSASPDGGLAIAADSAAGMLWHSLSAVAKPLRTARWRWRVEQGVAATDLTKRGVDDRAVAVYFVFSDRPAGSRGPMELLSSPAVTTLVYVFGGDKPRDSVIPSPHMGERGKFITLRAADANKQVWFDEKVDLSSDYRRAFGRPMPTLIGVAVSSDSDDTQARNRASLQNFVIGE
ncbi:MAG: DUF3047 domain-containing protein [Pseudolabrys sp.]|nr:DUF3047 domain-containing protein [Pseudolabrys sp.]MDP2299022.1 DUF3047 domain-containing protein [Pseudolabrys sp.]